MQLLLFVIIIMMVIGNGLEDGCLVYVANFNTHSYRSMSSMRWMHTLLRVYGSILRLFTYMLYIILASFFILIIFARKTSDDNSRTTYGEAIKLVG